MQIIEIDIKCVLFIAR